MSTDRDANGRYVPGHPGGPGRPRRAIEADYLAALSEAVPLDRWRTIVERAVADAENGDPRAREWLGSYLAGKPTGNALRRLAAAEAEAAAPVEEPPAACDVLDVNLDMERALAPAQAEALAALVDGQSVTAASREAGVSPGTVRRWLAYDPTFIAAHGAALSERDGRLRGELASLGTRAVSILRDAIEGYGEPVEVRATVEVVKLLKINEPAPARASDPADAENEINGRLNHRAIESMCNAPLGG